MKNIIIVPSWIHRTFVREGISIKEILNYTKLCELISPDDLSALLSLQSYGPFSEYHISENDADALYCAWKNNIISLTKGRKPMDELDNFMASNKSKPLDKDQLKFLISGETRPEGAQKSFEIIPGDNNNLLLVLKDGYFGDQDYETQDANVIENIIRVLYGEFVQEEIAQTAIFKRYVKMLSK